MTETVIRPAPLSVRDKLADLKSRYVRMLYRGFIPEEFLAIAEPAYYTNQLRDWLTQDQLHIDLLMRGEEIGGYIAYGVDRVDPSFGYIQEIVMRLPLDSQDYALLYQHALAQLAAQGYPQVHQWVLRDNFRMRFQLELQGFKADGARRSMVFEGQPLQITRYLYRGENG